MYELEYGLWLSGLCLRQLMIDHVSVRFTWMFCSICMPPTWLVPHQRTEWQVEHRQSAACLISCNMQRPLTERNTHHFLLFQNDGDHALG
jgi:hypothetical protein